MSNSMDRALLEASLCWSDEETREIPKSDALVEAIAKRLSRWMDGSLLASESAEYYRRLLLSIYEVLPPKYQEMCHAPGGVEPLMVLLVDAVQELSCQACQFSGGKNEDNHFG